MAQLDLRVMRLGVEVNGQMNTYDGLAIQASGTKYANPLQDDCAITVANLSRETRQFLLTETSPFNKNKTPKRIRVEAGRVSTGLAVVFEGDITEASPTLGPDIRLDIKAKTGNFSKTNVIAVSQASQAPLSRIAQQIATALELSLIFEATDKQISNYSFTGAALKQVDKLAQAGGVNAFVDGSQLIVKDVNVPLQQVVHTLGEGSGLIGLPELTEHGVRVKYLYDPNSRVGGRLDLESSTNTALTGSYEIFKLSFDLASHDVAWYTTAEAKRL